MPGKKGFTSKDYQSPLRKPGEKLDTSTATEDSVGKETASASKESEKVATEERVEDPKSSQDSEEKPAVVADNKQNESDEKEKPVLPQTADKPEATKDNTDKQDESASSSVKSDKDSNIAEPSEEVKDEALKTEATGKGSKLSPLAVEFVPKGTYNLTSAVNAPAFVPAPVPQQNNRPPLLRQKSNTPENELMNCVKDALFGLTQSPGELDYYVDTLVKMLKKWCSKLISLKEVVDVIFEYSIKEPNFQYIAAKLCNFLSKEQSIVLSNGEKFRSVFMNRCRDEHLNREVSLKSPDTLPKLLGFAMFEAELFCNYRPLGESQPLKVFHRGLLEMLNTLLQNRTEDCLKCIGKMLKMTGYLLDDPRFMQDDKDRKEKVDKVFSDMEKLQKESMLSDSVKSLLSQVTKLRATNWGYSATEGTATAQSADDGYYFSDYGLGVDELSLDDDLTPVTNPEQWSDYYDDGEELTLLQDTYKYYFPEQFPNDGDYGDEEAGGYYLEEDPEFDDEIDEEFEKFLQEQEALQ
ncbi:polyadenylate-binding protein-interacting protein 1-like isoform X2 [Oculina patagonica]